MSIIVAHGFLHFQFVIPSHTSTSGRARFNRLKDNNSFGTAHNESNSLIRYQIPSLILKYRHRESLPSGSLTIIIISMYEAEPNTNTKVSPHAQLNISNPKQAQKTQPTNQNRSSNSMTLIPHNLLLILITPRHRTLALVLNARRRLILIDGMINQCLCRREKVA